MKNQRYPSLAGHIFFKGLMAAFALVFLCSCTSSVYDMRQLNQPVVLNNNPFLLSRTTPSPKLVKIDAYSASVDGNESDANGTNTTSKINTAQLNAFLKIGGEPDCSIRNVTLVATSESYFFYVAYGGGADIEATGEVAQIQAPLPGRTGQSLTNQLALPPTVQK